MARRSRRGPQRDAATAAAAEDEGDEGFRKTGGWDFFYVEEEKSMKRIMISLVIGLSERSYAPKIRSWWVPTSRMTLSS